MKKFLSLILFVLIAALGVYFWKDYQTKAREAQLRAAVTKYWDAKIINDLPTLYHLEAGFVKDQLSPLAFMPSVSSVVREVSYEITQIEVMGERAIVNVSSKKTFPAIAPLSFDGKHEESWVLINEAWYREGPVASAPTLPGMPAPSPEASPAPADSGV